MRAPAPRGLGGRALSPRTSGWTLSVARRVLLDEPGGELRREDELDLAIVHAGNQADDPHFCGAGRGGRRPTEMGSGRRAAWLKPQARACLRGGGRA